MYKSIIFVLVLYFMYLMTVVNYMFNNYGQYVPKKMKKLHYEHIFNLFSVAVRLYGLKHLK